MNAKADSFLKLIQNFNRKFPIRLNFIVVIAIAIILFFNLKNIVGKDNSYLSIIWLMAKVGLIMLSTIVSISIISTLIAWFNLKQIKKNNPQNFSLEIKNNQTNQKIKLKIPKSINPLLGYIDISFSYNNKISSLMRLQQDSIIYKTKIEGNIELNLPDIKVYNINSYTLYIKDMLHLLSLPITINTSRTLLNTPNSILINETETTPRKTEELEIRIKELRKSEGEWLHYKNFENNDDIRRIVWKIFAKNKELVVRNPEIFNPYASRIDILASFHKSIFFKTESIENELLNFYKKINWTIYNELSKGEFAVQYLTDTPIAPVSIDKEVSAVASVITVAQWQNNIQLKENIGSKNLASIIIHSLNNAEDIAESLELVNKNTIVYFAPLSKGLRRNYSLGILHKLFFINNTSISRTWLEYSDINTLKQNEKKIESILYNSGKKYAIVI